MIRYTPVALLAVLPLAGQAQQTIAVMPIAAQVSLGPGKLRLDSTFTITISGYQDDRLKRAVLRTLGRLEARIGQAVRRDSSAGPRIVIRAGGAGQQIQTPDENESYKLTITSTGG